MADSSNSYSRSMGNHLAAIGVEQPANTCTRDDEEGATLLLLRFLMCSWQQARSLTQPLTNHV